MRKFLKREKPILFMAAMALCFALWVLNSGCAGTKISDTARAEYREKASVDVYEQNAASIETMRADSVIIVKYDTIAREKTLVKYYGIEKTKTDTVFVAVKQTEIERDTIYATEKISEKREDVFMKTWKIVFAIGFVAAAYFLWRGRK